MRKLTSLEEANACSALRLTEKRQRAKVGDIFRLSPYPNVFLWGRLIKRANFFGQNFLVNLVYIYDVISSELPERSFIRPDNLIIGPAVVNNLGWSRGYWEIILSRPITQNDIQKEHLFVQYRGIGSSDDYDLVDEQGRKSNRPNVDPKKLSQAGFGNYNNIDWKIRSILKDRAVPNKTYREGENTDDQG